MVKKLYTKKTKKKPAQKADSNGLVMIPNYKKKADKKASYNSQLLGTMDIKWQE